MAYIVRTVFLFLMGLWLKHQFKRELSFNSLKIVMMQVFLPAVIFYLILTNKDGISEIGLWNIVVATLFLNFITFACAKYVLPVLFPKLGQKIINTNAVMLSAYAPCITVVPIAAAVSTNINATYAVLFDIGDKFFIFVVLFGYISLQVQEKSAGLWHNAKFFFRKIILQPINLALFLSLFLSSQGVSFDQLPSILQQLVVDIKGPLLILIPIFIAGVVNFENLSRTLVSVLMYKYGFGFVMSGLFLMLFPNVLTAGLGLLAVTAPLACSSMWAKQNLMEFDPEQVAKQFDLAFADDLFTNSFGISLILNFLIFSIGDSFVNPPLLLSCGLGLIAAATLFYRASEVTRIPQPALQAAERPLSEAGLSRGTTRSRK